MGDNFFMGGDSDKFLDGGIPPHPPSERYNGNPGVCGGSERPRMAECGCRRFADRPSMGIEIVHLQKYSLTTSVKAAPLADTPLCKKDLFF